MRAFRKKGIVTMLLAGMILALTASKAAVITANAAQNDKRKQITVVYDDSGSMVKDDKGVFTDRWCQAKYAMEVMAAMMNSEDTLSIFPMSQYASEKPYLEINGSDSADRRVSKVHNMVTNAGNTKYQTVTNAKKYLSGQQGADQWLLVLTDGAFEDGAKPMDEINEDFAQFASEGIKIVYLAMGPEAEAIVEDRDNGIFYYKADVSSAILPKLTEIANLIFARQALDESAYIQKSGQSMNIHVDVPMEKIIVFAQGDHITLGELNGAASNTGCTSNINVNYCDKVNPNYAKYGREIRIADNLSGIVAEFQGTQEGSIIETGDYSLSISDASNVQVYYKIAVDVEMTMSLSGQEVRPGSEIPAGNYDFSLQLVHPLTREPLQSDMLKRIGYRSLVENGEYKEEFDSKTFTMKLEPGEMTAEGRIYLTDDTYVSRQLSCDVVVPIDQFVIQYNSTTEVFDLDRLDKKEKALLIKATEGGEPLSAEQWNKVRLAVSTDCKVKLLLEKGDEVSTWKLYPMYYENIESTQTGDIDFLITASMERDGQTAESKADGKLRIEAEAIPILISLKCPQESYDVHVMTVVQEDCELYYFSDQKIEGESPIVAEYTIEGRPFTSEEWKNVTVGFSELQVRDKKDEYQEGKMKFLAVKGTGKDVSKVYLYPKLYENKEKTSEGLVRIELTGDYVRYGTLCSGRGGAEFQVIGLTLIERIRRILIIIIILIIILGYAPFGTPFGKSYMTKRTFRPYYEWRRKSLSGKVETGKSNTRYRVWKLFGFIPYWLIPYKNFEATITTRMPSNKVFPDLQIKACRSGVLIKNLKAFENKGVKIGGIDLALKPNEKSRVVSGITSFTFQDNSRTEHTLHFK